MIRIHKTIKREQLFELIKDSRIAKVEINRRENVKLYDVNICRVYIYFNSDESSPELQNKFNIKLSKFLKELRELGSKKGDGPFLNGLQNFRKVGFITMTDVDKVKIIADKHNKTFPNWNIVQKIKEYEI